MHLTCSRSALDWRATPPTSSSAYPAFISSKEVERSKSTVAPRGSVRTLWFITSGFLQPPRPPTSIWTPLVVPALRPRSTRLPHSISSRWTGTVGLTRVRSYFACMLQRVRRALASRKWSLAPSRRRRLSPPVAASPDTFLTRRFRSLAQTKENAFRSVLL